MTDLSPREREVVVLVGRDGKQWKCVAQTMGVTLGTVRSYALRIMVKTGITRPPREAMVEIYFRRIDRPIYSGSRPLSRAEEIRTLNEQLFGDSFASGSVDTK